MTTIAGKRIALVTGANKGIGKEIVRGLARDGLIVYLGARDAVRGRAAEAELRADGDVRFVALDVTDAASVRAAAEAIESAAGRLDVLVNNAGISSAPGSRFRTPVEESAENIRAVYETNVFAVVTVTNTFMPLLLRSDAGRIVNVTSKRGSIGEEGAWVGRPYMAYSTSKTALNALTAHYARSLAETSIKVNGAAPGHVATDFNGFRGTRTPEEGAAVAIQLAQLDCDGPTGLVFEDDVRLRW
ncbi:SDR family NAD(P)-dependent oxidoreductase [Granulicella sp. dw_53]|uniref:SDR family NAD(P)-dependent oxidoreductase n=1 Tax=Granulicella sp. dw_53 TaxID=2719792 RepID=UPI001BD3D847|nr:SDR family NAD(P)-dependent oxidoreductase [Granulicella sp. dw_53]